MRVLRGLVAARVTGARIRALVQGNGQRAKVGTGLGKRVVRGARIGVLRKVNWGSNLLIACIFTLAFGSGSKAQEQAGGTVVQKVTASETFVEPQALIGPQVVLDEFLREGVKGDYVAAGVGMRNLGEGTININLPAASTIVRAFLYWAIVREPGPPARNRGKLNGTRIKGTLVGTSGDPCWPVFDAGNFVDVFRAEVSGIVQQGVNILSDFPSGLTDNTPPQNAPEAFPLLEGASLIVIFENSAFGFNTVIIRDGAQTLNREALTTSFGSFTAETTTAPDEIAKTTYIVADGQAQFQADQATFKGIVVAGPTSGVKSVDAFDGADGIANVDPLNGLWDTLTVDVSSQFTPGVATSADASAVAGTGGDCLTWIVQVLSVKTAPPGFDFPVGNPNGDPADADYATDVPLALQFGDPTDCLGKKKGTATHPGEDWNSKAGGFSDRDDPVYAIASGEIVHAALEKPSYGNVVIIRHTAPEGHPFIDPQGGTLDEVWSVYYHMDTITQAPNQMTKQKMAPLVPRNWQVGDYVERGQQIGTIGGLPAGTNEGVHLHLEIRRFGLKTIPATWKSSTVPCTIDPDDEEELLRFYVEPTAFINSNCATTPSTTGFWNFIDQNSRVDIFMSDQINPELVTLEEGDEGMVPHSLCGIIVSCLMPSTGLWWYGVAHHRHRDEVAPGSTVGEEAAHATFIDWVFDEGIQSAKNGGLSTVPNQGQINFRFGLSKVDDPVFLFTTWWEIESVDADAFDLMQVFLTDQNNQQHHLLTLNPVVDVDGPGDVPFSSAGEGLEPIWVDHQIDLEEFSGQTVTISFRFDSVDANYNGFRGWLIDRPAVISFVNLPLSTNSFADEIMMPSIDPCPGGSCRIGRVRE